MRDFIGLKLLWPKDGDKLQEHKQDIVLVHSLRSGPVSGWQNEDHSLWPVELLAQDLKTARIFSFGYDQGTSSVRSDDLCESGSVFNHGEALCGDLRDKQKGARSMTFIGHGTGGIVIKSALCYSQSRQTQFGFILRKTKHVIFLDTPHSGLNEGAWCSISGDVLNEGGKGQWSLWSTVLSDLRRTFAEISVRFNITSACASLTDRPRGFKDDVAPGDSGLTYLPHELPLYLERVDHMNISKFHKDTVNYDRLLDRIRTGMTCLTKDEEHIQRLRRWIGGGLESHAQSETWNQAAHERNLSRHHPNTCRWLFKDPRFKSWSEKPNANPILWLTAPGGAGKSVMCSLVVDAISKRTQPPATPYLMVTFNQERSRCQIATLLASQLLDYVLKEQQGVDTEALSLLAQNASICDNVYALINLLISQCSSVFFFLDGINETYLVESGDSSKRRDELQRLNDDLKTTLTFLTGLARDNQETRIRLWCSSQKTNSVVNWINQLGGVELAIDEKLVQADVSLYLSEIKKETLNRIPNVVERLEVEVLLTRAEANFRWACMMKDILQDPKLTLDDLVRMVRKGLPGDLREIYAARLEELMKLDKKDRQDGRWPLAEHILSLVTFARRPLKVEELQEALTILRYPVRTNPDEYEYCDNLAIGKLVPREGILHYCAPLVDFVPVQGSKDGYMILSHWSVVKFLRPSATQNEEVKNGKESFEMQPTEQALVNHIDQNIIADACFKYLSQDRYSTLLKKTSATNFEIATSHGGGSVQDHHFLRYASKYWYRHLDASGFGRFDQVKSFVLSPQFLTAIQVQSLFLSGHFINNFEHIEANLRVMKQNLPEWFDNCQDGRDILAQYESFLIEWSRYLRLGVTDFEMHGEIDRCLWGALGKQNFLYKWGSRIEQNPSFLLDETDYAPSVAGQKENRSHCYYETISNDGSRIAIWKVAPTSSDPDSASGGFLQLTRDAWYIDGNAPFRYGPTEHLTFHRGSVGWDLFDPCRSREIYIIPSVDTSIRALPIGDCQFGVGVRVGSGTFIRQIGGIWTDTLSDNSSNSIPYWEDVIIQGRYIVRSRRKLIDPDMVGFSTAQGQSSSNQRDVNLDARPVHNDDDTSSQGSDEMLECFEELVSSADEFCALISDSDWSGDENASSSGASSRDEQPDMTIDKGGNRDILDSEDEEDDELSSSSDADLDTESKSDSDTKSESDIESDSASSTAKLATPQSTVESGAGNESWDNESNDDVEDDDEELAPNQPGVSRTLRYFARWRCDKCNATIISPRLREAEINEVISYQCSLCAIDLGHTQYDLCSECFEKGSWCKKTDHQLHKVRFKYSTRRVLWLDTISRHDARPVINIAVERMETGTCEFSRLVFRYSARDSSMLHNSRPVMHPNLPLLVYPLDGRRFLFANMLENTYFVHKVPFDDAETSHTGGNICIPVSVDMQFSLCGYYLHVARVTSRRQAADTAPTKLFIQVITVALCRKDVCSGRPKTLARRSGIELGKWRTTTLYQLPFAITWTNSDLYVSLSREFLRVFKISHHLKEEKRGNSDSCRPVTMDSDIYTLSKGIALPRSARFRSVNFFPATDRGAARIVLGSAYGGRPQPPAVLYLKAENVGYWIKAEDAVLTFSEIPTTRNDPLLEDFDADDDCDLIIPITDFQR
ncbi:hypothetical protein F4801DRAFT_528531 [Xylaria longipes]|nr:hypothetical protein F4801DRAFT_528531 [Xylaria longipes]